MPVSAAANSDRGVPQRPPFHHCCLPPNTHDRQERQPSREAATGKKTKKHIKDGENGNCLSHRLSMYQLDSVQCVPFVGAIYGWRRVVGLHVRIWRRN